MNILLTIFTVVCIILTLTGLGVGIANYYRDQSIIEASNGPNHIGMCSMIGVTVPYDCYAQRPAVPCEAALNTTTVYKFIIDPALNSSGGTNESITCTWDENITFYSNIDIQINGTSFPCWSSNFSSCDSVITTFQLFGITTFTIVMISIGAIGGLLSILLIILHIVFYKRQKKHRTMIHDNISIMTV
ncbi:MAG: hypothetical protein Terrestrivirus1_188 [Terrestrivirus sp.]|uniref:Uncharacterized protein n=1 Tax=Terrestrivirus sp. TaxID=2487775 RepID=A0A3G4ZLM3_9VIRU|nr:MAG: hypothetical protein Terrestrivirus1_188 [Terrestrivirus sp.]